MPVNHAVGSNYVQYGRTDYVCGGYYNGSTRFRIADIEREVLAALELYFLVEPIRSTSDA